jgi:eukaryotic-like serine/threonine-protein kinase
MAMVRSLTVFFAFSVILLFSCKKSEDNPTPTPTLTPPADTVAITKFTFRQSDNHFMFGTDSVASIGEDSILINMPGGTDVTKIIPTIIFQGKTVQPASGTAQNFTGPVTYTVTDSTGKTKSYIVKITLTGANEVIIAAYNESAYDLTTGKLRWLNSNYINFYYSATASDGKYVFSSNATGDIYALDVVTGNLGWTKNYSFGPTRTPAIYNGVLYLSGGDQNIRALDAATGNIIWNKYYNINNLLQTMDAYNGALYFIASDNRIYSANSADGTLNWQTDPSLVFVGSPTVVGNTLYASGYDSNVYAMDAGTGNVKWKSKTGFLKASPAVSNGVIYVASTNDSLYSIDATTGKLSWVSYVNAITTEVYSPTPISSSPTAANGQVFVSGSDANLHAFDSGTGAPQWATVVNQTGLQMIYLDGVVYTGSYALNATNGSVIWSGPALSSQNLRFAVIAKDGTIYNPVN